MSAPNEPIVPLSCRQGSTLWSWNELVDSLRIVRASCCKEVQWWTEFFLVLYTCSLGEIIWTAHQPNESRTNSQSPDFVFLKRSAPSQEPSSGWTEDRSFPKFLFDIISTNKSQRNFSTQQAHCALNLPAGVKSMVLKRTRWQAEDREGLLP
jgi:hypothetical protein